MDSFLDRIAKLPHKKLALLASELYERSLAAYGAVEPIAITAMACRMPGGIDTPEAFWSLLERGGDAIEPIPAERLEMTGTDAASLDGQGVQWGGFLTQVDAFDPAVFGISAKETASMDPQQRLLLEVCWEALENVGTPIDALDSETGVFMGVSGFDYAMLSHRSGREQDGYVVTGVANAVAAGRISYVFGLNGPSMVLDTACSASASAIHLACQSLRARECDQALAGGINLLLLPQITQTISGLQGLAKDGRCKAFSAAADGFVRSEGCGVIVLRRLSEATSRREPILGVIRGSAWNQDGKSGGLTAPNGAAQERVIRTALSSAKLAPDQISYVEAHGTGTALGDPIEISALGRVFAPRAGENLIVGSVKTNVGHLEAAAGVTGVVKVLLALRHETIPPHLHAATLNSQVAWSELPISIATQGAAWPRGAAPRVAGVSSFGLSGTNVHLLIAEPPAETGDTEPADTRARTLLTVSAKSREALLALAGRIGEALAHRPGIEIAAFAAAANLKRAHFAHRLVLSVADPAEAAAELRRFSQGDAASRVRTAFIVQHRPPRIGLLFGDAPPDVALLARLRESEPTFRAAYETWLAGSPQPAAMLLPPVSAAVGFQFALAELWRSWGIRPALVVGKGSAAGIIAAALVAGGLRAEDAAVLADRVDRGLAPGPVATQAVTLKLLIATLCDPVEPGQTLPPTCFAAALLPLPATVCAGAADRLIALHPANGDALLDELAAIYLAGAAVNWSSFHRAERPDPAVLPNYPFQRTRHWPAWLADKVPRHATDLQSTQAIPDQGTYHIEWLPTEQPQDGPDPSAVMAALRPRLVELDAEQDFGDVRDSQRDLDNFAILVISAALRQLQPGIRAGTMQPEGTLAASLGVIPEQARLLERMFHALEAGGFVVRRGGSWTFIQDLPDTYLEAELAQLRRAYPRYSVEIDIGARASLLGDVLCGRATGVEVLFPNGSFALLEALYRDSLAGRLMNQLVGETIAALANTIDRPLRVLEIGAGTGSTTAAVLPQLPKGTEYVFTDVSPAFLVPARAAFAHRSIRFEVLDIENTASVRALAAKPFDLVVAANVLHATRSLRETLAHVRSLLRPDGALVILEGIKTLAITDVTLGMLEGWWRHEDSELRSSGPLLDQERWRQVLDTAGFEAASLPQAPDFGGITEQQTVIVARLRPSLVAAGQSSTVTLLYRDPTAASAARASLEAADLAVLDAPLATTSVLQTAAAGPAGIWLYLAPHYQGAGPLADAAIAASDMFTIAQSLQNLGAAAPSLWVATAGAQPTSGTMRPADAALWGIGRVLASEVPGLRSCFVDLEFKAPDWDSLARLIASGSEAPERAIVKGRILTPRLAPIQLAARSSEPVASAEGSYIVTGGFGVLGTYAACWLAEQSAGKLFLVGRNPPGAAALTAIEAARHSGAEVETIVADIATADGVAALFARVEADAKPLRGIIHAAASLDDAPISRQTQASFAHAFEPKAAGAWLLHERSLGHSLDFFVLYSSVASLFGSAGQANYAAANAFIDALAHHRRALGLPAISINWGLWSSTGAAIKRDVVEIGTFQGAIPITPEHGHAVLARALASNKAQLAVLLLDWAMLQQALGSRRPPALLQALLSRPRETATASAQPSSGLVTTYATLIGNVTGAERNTLLIDFIRQRAGELLNLDPDTSIADDRPLLELGLDSLVGLELKNDLQTLSGLTFPSTLFFDCPTLIDLALYLRVTLPSEPPQGAVSAEDELEHILI